MAHKFRDLYNKVPAERRAEIEKWVDEAHKNMPLQQLRSAREMTQVNLAKVLGVDQGSVSKMEKRADMYLSTLRSYIEAMGGTMEIRAVFPDGIINVDLTQQ
jgi:DNA-binding XRE family transcriptional regulator